MNLSERIRLILSENKLKQKELAADIGVTESYISAIVNGRNSVLSRTLAALIEEKYGYSAEWILNGTEPKLKQVSKNKALSVVHQKALLQLERLNEEQIKAVLAFINALDEIEDSFNSQPRPAYLDRIPDTPEELLQMSLDDDNDKNEAG